MQFACSRCGGSQEGAFVSPDIAVVGGGCNQDKLVIVTYSIDGEVEFTFFLSPTSACELGYLAGDTPMDLDDPDFELPKLLNLATPICYGCFTHCPDA